MSFPLVEPPPETPHRAKLGDRRLFPDLEPVAYLNHAAISPPSVALKEMVGAALDDFGRLGVSAFGPWYAQRMRLKARLARLLGGEANEIAFVLNTTAGINAIAQCFPWQTGDRVICFRGEFPTNVTPWLQAAKTFGLEIEMLEISDFARADSPDFSALEKALEKPTRMVAISAVQFQTGLRVPLSEISARCRAAGAEVCVDAIQAIGSSPLDLKDCDYVAAGGHKWLMGLEGAGFLWARADRAERLVPRVAGWLSHQNGADFLFEGPGKMTYDKPFKTGIDFIEGGASNMIGYAAMGASTTLLEQVGVDAIYAHANRYADALEPGIVELGFKSARLDGDRRSAILAFTPPPGIQVGPLVGKMSEFGVAASSPDGYLRFAPHWPNNLDEVPKVIEAVDRALAALRAS